MIRYFLLALALNNSAHALDRVEIISHSGNTVGFSVSGIRSNSCAPDKDRFWRATSSNGVLKLYFWDSFLGDACFSQPRDFSVDLSLRSICVDGATCGGSVLEVYSVSGGCLPSEGSLPTCVETDSTQVRVQKFSARGFRGLRTTTGPWEYHGESFVGPTLYALTISEIDSQFSRMLFQHQDSPNIIDGSFDGGIFLGADRSGINVFAYLKTANILVSDISGRAMSYYRYDADGRVITAPEPFVPPNNLKTDPLLVGGTYMIIDPSVPARIIEVRGSPNEVGFAQIKIDGKYGGGVTCSRENCVLEFATSQGVFKTTLPSSSFGYEAIFNQYEKSTVFAVRLSP